MDLTKRFKRSLLIQMIVRNKISKKRKSKKKMTQMNKEESLPFIRTYLLSNLLSLNSLNYKEKKV